MKYIHPLIGLVFLTLLTVISGCEEPFMIPLSEYGPEVYDGELSWEQSTAEAAWSPRYDHASIVFDGAMWVIGGYDSTVRGDKDCYLEDVWKSTDGITWELVAERTEWSGRRGHALAVFQDELYLIGGFAVEEETGLRGYSNEVWKSADGVRWELVTDDALWEPRMNHEVFAADSALYLAGGFYHGMYYCDDIWKYDGSTWSEMSAKLPGERASYASCELDGKWYLQGGSFSGMEESSTGRADERVERWDNAWVFDPANEAEGWNFLKRPLDATSRRSEHVMVPFMGKIWMFAGKSNAGWRFSKTYRTYSTEVYDPMTNTWSRDSLGSGFGPRYSYSAEVFTPVGDSEPSLFILGGFSNNGPLNDVWKVKGEF
ncbi:MAG: hypothetical protein K9L21_05300 [Spirochaetia bacterium]|nr:hypothetical protein [Spirochaetia bacterium]